MSAVGRTVLLLQDSFMTGSSRQHVLTAVEASTAPSTAAQTKKVAMVRQIQKYDPWHGWPGPLWRSQWHAVLCYPMLTKDCKTSNLAMAWSSYRLTTG